MSNDPYLVSKVDVVDPFSNNDHCAINFSLVLKAHERTDHQQLQQYNQHHPVKIWSDEVLA